MWCRNEIARDITPPRKSLVFLGLAGALLALAAVAGCDRGPTVVRVSGRVTFEGAPPAGKFVNKIMFLPTKSSRGSTARPATSALDSEGRYQLSTYGPGDGVTPGEYNVVIKSLFSGPTFSNGSAPEVWAIPERYGRASKSGLSATVPDGQSSITLDFDLKQ